MEDRRLIEDYLPITAIGAAASSEPRTKGHISTLHVWRARRPLVACRAAIYGALVPATQFEPENGPENRKASLGRANAAKFITALSSYTVPKNLVLQAQEHVLVAHAQAMERSGKKRAEPEAGVQSRPRVLDMFAGGGAIPLEAARLGCEAHALDLNPVAHLIELCTVHFPQRFGAGLADDVEKWGRIVLDKVRAEVDDLMAHIPAPSAPSDRQATLGAKAKDAPCVNELSIVAYYWTRTAPCPNPQCKGTVPLYRQTWLRKKSSGFVALQRVVDKKRKKVSFKVVAANTEEGLGFNPNEGSETSSTSCPFCPTVLQGKYVRTYGNEHGFGQQLMCVIALNPEGTGKLYIADESLAAGEEEKEALADERAAVIERQLGNSSLDELIPPTGNAGLATGNSYLYGITTFRQAFTPRQRLVLLTIAREIRGVYEEMLKAGMDAERAKAVATYLGLWLSRILDRCNSLCRWNNAREVLQGLTDMKRFAMMWDYPEVNLFGGASGDAWGNLEYITAVIRREGEFRNPAQVLRGSATELPYEDEFFDAVITDPPYYDNESYSELSDVCYVWLRPTIGFLYPEHFATPLTPKKKECVAAAYRQGGTKEAARAFYEDALYRSFQEAHRVTKSGGVLVVVYAHKTTLGWATLVDALRRAGYEVAEAWPLDTETKARVAHQGDAALATSIFLVTRKREGADTGQYESQVRPELEEIVRERVGTLWDMGISGADLVIACVGAGLRAFTRHARVEYANGEEVPAERFLSEVEAAVLESILARLSKEVGGNGGRNGLAGADPATRFYVLWKYTYRSAELDPGEAIVFANGTHVELDGPGSLSQGSHALVVKQTINKKLKYVLLDYSTRGADEHVGMPGADGSPAPVIDALHRTLWLMENQPSELPRFLKESAANREQMRLVAQALAGPALKGGEMGEVSSGGELAALAKLTANWRNVVEHAALSVDQKVEKKTGQQSFDFGKGGRG